MTTFGFGMNLFPFSRALSVLGIFVSYFVGVPGGLALIVIAYDLRSVYILPDLLYGAGAVILTIMIPYLTMWILLKNKTNKKDIPGIEKIGKIYSYVSGSLEIIGMIVYIGICIYVVRIGLVLGAAVYLIFVCLKIHGIRVEKNKLLGAYIGFRYVLFILYMIGLAILCALIDNLNWSAIYGARTIGVVIAFIVAFTFFILDIGLTVILHSIRVDRENTAGTENAV